MSVTLNENLSITSENEYDLLDEEEVQDKPVVETQSIANERSKSVEFQCLECAESFKADQELKSHIETTHQLNDKVFFA